MRRKSMSSPTSLVGLGLQWLGLRVCIPAVWPPSPCRWLRCNFGCILGGPHFLLPHQASLVFHPRTLCKMAEIVEMKVSSANFVLASISILEATNFQSSSPHRGIQCSCTSANLYKWNKEITRRAPELPLVFPGVAYGDPLR